MPRPKGSGIVIDLIELEELCALQCTQVEIAAFFNVSVPTIERRAREPKFREAMERGYAKGRSNSTAAVTAWRSSQSTAP